MVERILEVVLARAADAGARRITRVNLEAGPFSGVAEDALRFHWAEHAGGTIAAQADVVVTPTDDLIELRLVSFEAEDAASEAAAT
jgi:Zn finger protein HypA/HybF involved in hydrogenase expression